MGQKPFKNNIVTAEKFLLVDKNNKFYGGLGVDNDGGASLALMNGKNRNIELKIFTDGNSAIVMMDKNGKTITMISIHESQSQLQLNGKDGNGGVSLGGSIVQVEDKLDSPGLLISDKANKKRVILALFDSTMPVLFINNNDEKPVSMIAVTKEGKPRIALIDKEGKEVFEAP